MAVITVPANIGFDGCKIGLLRATAEHRSPFTGKRQVVTSAFALWQFEGTVVPLQGTDAGAARSFLAELRGRANTFRLPIPAAGVPLSLYAGLQGQVSSAGVLGTSVPTSGWSPNAVVFRRGDYFNIGDELKMATADVTANGSGVATIYFEPSLRAAPAINTIIKFQDPFLYLAAQEDDIASWGLKDFNTHNMMIKATEAFE